MLLAETPDFKSPEEKGYVHKDSNVQIENYNEHFEMLDWAGVSFGEETTFLIQKSIKRLAKLSGASKLRFFGKIICTG